MTERLTTLLSTEADLLDVPAPPAAAVLARGRGLRRRQHAGRAVAGLAALAVIGSGVALLQHTGDDPDAAIDPAAPDRTSPTPATGAVFSIGATVYLDGGARKAVIDDGAVKSLYYTSAGVLVRHGDNPYSDGAGRNASRLWPPTAP